MTTVSNKKKRTNNLFEYIYMVIMVIYMGQMTPVTSRMVSSISGNLFPFLLPIVASVFLWLRRPVSFFHRSFWIVIGLFFFWATLVINYYDSYKNEDLSYYFFLFYSIVIAYLHVQCLGKKFLPLYENVVVILAIISLVFWIWAVVYPTSASFFKQFEPTRYGNNVYFIFNWMDPTKDQNYQGLLRNSGFSWEPGRYSIILVLALLCNIARNGVKVFNFNTIILLIAIGSTLSTTGYTAAIILYIVSFVHHVSFKKSLLFFIFFIPSIVMISRLGFMRDKIEEQIQVETDLHQLEKSFKYNNETTDEGEYVGSLNRFSAIYFEWENMKEHPLLGYGRNPTNSYFYKNVSTNFVLTGGLVKILSQHGVIFGIIIYLMLLFSSFTLSRDFDELSPFALFLTFILFSVSYSIFTTPIFTAFWFYGPFRRRAEKTDKKERHKATLEELLKKERANYQFTP